MRKLLFFISLLSLQASCFAKVVDCQCEQKQMLVKLNIVEGKVQSIKTYASLPMRSIAESLPAGIYKSYQDINEQLNWYFEKSANLQILPIYGSHTARVQVMGQDQNSASRLVVFSKTLFCDEKF